jgi:hypothetical protein
MHFGLFLGMLKLTLSFCLALFLNPLLGQITIQPNEPIFLLAEIVEDTNLTFIVTNGHDAPKTVLLLKHAQCEPDEWVDQFCDEGFCYTTSINEIEIELEANETREYGITIAMNDVNGLGHYKVKATDVDNIDDFQFADIYVNTFDCLTTDLLITPESVAVPYPNPTSDYLFVDERVESGTLYDALGRVCSLPFDGLKFDFQSLPIGQYYLHLTYQNGGHFVHLINRN